MLIHGRRLCFMAYMFLSIHWIFFLVTYVDPLWVFGWLLILLPTIGIFSYMALNALYVEVCEFVADLKYGSVSDQLDAGDIPL